MNQQENSKNWYLVRERMRKFPLLRPRQSNLCYPWGGTPLENSQLKVSKHKFPSYKMKHKSYRRNKGFYRRNRGCYRRNKGCYRRNRRCYKKRKPLQNNRKNDLKRYRSLIHNLTYQPTKNLLREVGLYLRNFLSHSSLSWGRKEA